MPTTWRPVLTDSNHTKRLTYCVKRLRMAQPQHPATSRTAQAVRAGQFCASLSRKDFAMHRTHPFVSGLVASAAIALVAWTATGASAAPGGMTHTSHAAAPSLEKRITFRNAMGKYWEDHITWTRLFVISALSD